jgi:hypothetical protein
MKKLVYKIDYPVENLFIGNSRRTVTIEGRVYKEERKSLWRSKVFYTYTLNVPYIEDPFYDGEFNTNRILGVYASSVKQVLIDKINELEENDDTRTERQEGETGSSNKFFY